MSHRPTSPFQKPIFLFFRIEHCLFIFSNTGCVPAVCLAPVAIAIFIYRHDYKSGHIIAVNAHFFIPSTKSANRLFYGCIS